METRKQESPAQIEEQKEKFKKYKYEVINYYKATKYVSSLNHSSMKTLL